MADFDLWVVRGGQGVCDDGDVGYVSRQFRAYAGLCPSTWRAEA